jgi:hypothetical protein
MVRWCLVMVLVAAMVAGAAARLTFIATFPVAGRKYKLQNQPMDLSLGVVCPDANPSTVAFCRAGQKVKIVGNFAAPDLGVCDPNVNPYTLAPTSVVTYEQYGDQVVFRISDRVPAAFRCLLLNYGKKVCVGLSSQRYGVSTLTDYGPANC